MIKTDEDALICDLAETYNIYDYKRLPLLTVATFSLGLRDNSRIKLAMSGMKVSLETSLLASAVDRLGILAWQKTKDGSKGINMPQSILSKLMETEDESMESEHRAFSSGEEFMKVRNELLKKGGK